MGFSALRHAESHFCGLSGAEDSGCPDVRQLQDHTCPVQCPEVTRGPSCWILAKSSLDDPRGGQKREKVKVSVGARVAPGQSLSAAAVGFQPPDRAVKPVGMSSRRQSALLPVLREISP